jgi:hypothetical protein
MFDTFEKVLSCSTSKTGCVIAYSRRPPPSIQTADLVIQVDRPGLTPTPMTNCVGCPIGLPPGSIHGSVGDQVGQPDGVDIKDAVASGYGPIFGGRP